jgi:hypothetical protein
VRRLSSRHLAEAEGCLEAARVAQADFWRSLTDLETSLGTEIEASIDLRDAHLEDLLDPTKRHEILGKSKEQHNPLG